MMKKTGIIVVLFVLTFSFSVKAEVFMEIDCDNDSITSKKSVNCEGNLVYEGDAINDISFDYQTNLDVKFSEVSGFPLSQNGNKITIHANNPLHDIIMSSSVIIKFTISANSNSQEQESITFKNFKINDNSSEIIPNVAKNFNVKVTHPLDSNCLLSSITIDKVIVPNFDKNKFEYDGITVSSNVVFIDAMRDSDKSSVTGLGQVYVDPGKKITHTITVTAEDNTKKEYKLYITNKSTNVEEGNIEPQEQNNETIQLSSDNTLKTLEILNGKVNIPFTFDNKKDNFEIKIDDDKITAITIKASLNDNKATFIDKYGPRDIKLTYGQNKILLKVKAENTEEKVYTLNVELKDNRSSDASLKSLIINDEVIKLVDKVYKYEITLAKSILKTNIEAIANSDKAKSEYKDIELKPGNNSIIVTVIAENGDKKDYTINVIQSEEEEIDNSLQAISVEGYNLGFLKDKKEYTLKVASDTESLKIILKPSNIDYKILGNSELKNGSVIKIRIADESEYTITIQKNLSKNNSLIYIISGIIVVILIVEIIYLIKKKKSQVEVI